MKRVSPQKPRLIKDQTVRGEKQNRFIEVQSRVCRQAGWLKMHTRSFGNDEISNFIDDHESQSFPIFSFFLLINMNAEFEGTEYP